jgi:hypothetical protein
MRPSELAGPGQCLPDEWLPAATKEAAQNDGDDNDVVELPRDGDEVGYEVKGKREVAGERDQESLLAAGNAWVAKQAAAEDDAVRYEPGECPGFLTPSCD